MLLPERILWHTDEAPRGNLTHTQAVAVPCHGCKRVLLLVADDSRVVGRSVAAQNPPETLYLDATLGCVGSGCEFLAPLYAQWSPDTTEEERRSDTKTWAITYLTKKIGQATVVVA